jgi:glycosyltransferase involved in cell wall biosynthesis
VIVEDPSEAPGREMIEDLLADPRIRYYSNEARTGLVAQRNQALELSRGQWIAVLDADDIAEPHRLACQLDYVSRHASIAVLGSWLTVIDSEGRTIGMRRYPADHQAIARAMRRYNAVAQPAVVFRRAAALRVGAYQGAPYVEDYDLWCRMLKAGHLFGNVPHPLVRYRVHKRASKSVHLRHLLAETINIKRRYFGRELGPGDRLRLAGEGILLRLPAGLVYWLFSVLSYRPSRAHGTPLERSEGADRQRAWHWPGVI